MSIVITTVEGKPAVEIEAATGEVFAYLYRARRGQTSWVVELTKLDQGTGVSSYIITLRDSGSWDCTCPQALYRRARCNAEGGCKHVRHARELVKVLESMGVGS